VKVREAVRRGQSSDPKARANGYCHKYFDTHGINLLALATFPSDDAIAHAASEAAQEAESLIRLLGVNPSQLLRHMGGNLPQTLPGISTWYQDDESNIEDDGAIDGDDDDDFEELQALVDAEETTLESRSCKHDDQVLSLTFASLCANCGRDD
jgi:hypothetical protein